MNKKNTLTFIGDVYLPNAYKSSVDLDNYIVNLEYPITKHNIGAHGKINLKADTNHIKQTFSEHPLAVCLANNHILDYGITGYSDTINSLDNNNIKYFGCGSTSNNYNNPFIFELSGIKVALLGYACKTTSPALPVDDIGISLIENDRIVEDICYAKSISVDRIIVNLHWGAEEIAAPKPSDVYLARSIIDAGADLIIGHHSHCIQSHEKYKGKYIFYGLGNGIFPDLNVDFNFNENTRLSEGKYVKKQRPWNKTSLMVKYNITTEKVLIEKLHFTGQELTHKRGFILSKQRTEPSDSKLSFIEARYSLVSRLCIFRVMITNYLANPKFITYKHIKLVWNQLIGSCV